MHVSDIPNKRNHRIAAIAAVLSSQARATTNKVITYARNMKTAV